MVGFRSLPRRLLKACLIYRSGASATASLTCPTNPSSGIILSSTILFNGERTDVKCRTRARKARTQGGGRAAHTALFAPSRWKTCFNHLLAKDDGVEMPLSTGHTSIVSCPGTHIRLVLGIGDMPQGPDRHTGVSPVSLTDRTCLDDSLLSNTRPSRTLSSRVGGMPHIKDMARWFHCATRPNRALGLCIQGMPQAPDRHTRAFPVCLRKTGHASTTLL